MIATMYTNQVQVTALLAALAIFAGVAPSALLRGATRTSTSQSGWRLWVAVLESGSIR